MVKKQLIVIALWSLYFVCGVIVWYLIGRLIIN